MLLPELALDVWQRATLNTGALVILEGPSQRRTVACANTAARTQGVHIGMSWAAARALLPELTGLARDLKAEQQALQQLASWAYQYSSRIALGEQNVQLEIAASHRLFGQQLLHQMHTELAAQGWQVCFGHGPTPASARLAARCSANLTRTGLRSRAYERIRALAPIAFTELPDAQKELLYACGIRTVADWQALPAAGLIRRIGRSGLRIRAILDGSHPEALPEYRPPAQYRAHLELPSAIHSSESLLFPIKRMLGDLCGYLRARDCAVQHWQWQFHPERSQNMPPTVHLPLGLSQASRELAHLYDISRLALERVVLPSAVQSLSLEVTQFWLFQSEHRDLFDRSEQASTWPQVLERLRSRLGADAVQALAWHADHRPEHLPPDDQGKPQPLAQNDIPCAVQSRPLWLLPAPCPVKRDELRMLTALERIEAGWWDGHDIRRDYYLALNAQGQHIWVYQDLREPHQWFQHGVFG